MATATVVLTPQFSTVASGVAVGVSFTITNTGNAPATLLSLVPTATGSADVGQIFFAPTMPLVVPPSGSASGTFNVGVMAGVQPANSLVNLNCNFQDGTVVSQSSPIQINGSPQFTFVPPKPGAANFAALGNSYMLPAVMR